MHYFNALQLPPNGSGSLVFKIDPLAPAADTLEVNDVVLEIEGVPIADDGTVEFRNEERVEFSHIVRSKHIGRLYTGSRSLELAQRCVCGAVVILLCPLAMHLAFSDLPAEVNGCT